MTDDAKSKYQRIADDLRSEIVSARLVEGDRLPGENDLMKRYGVARMTARQALSVLQDDGLAVARKGAGVFVRASSSVPRIHRMNPQRAGTWRVASSPWDAEVEPGSLTVDRIVVDHQDDVVVRSRRYVVAGQPVMLAASSIPANLAAGTSMESENPGPGGVYARLADVGRAPVRFRETVTARPSTAFERQALNLRGDAVSLVVQRLAYDVDGATVETSDLVMNAAVFALSYDFDV
ncbi:GntR family transcriptional regulator [Streptomyces sp. NPDC057509]|uniref:GntR family transcriptional regulator n=1 Tax=Streptomyces sp. NPDC057509 TaxID=3346152 RepID=UPI0036A0E71A